MAVGALAAHVVSAIAGVDTFLNLPVPVDAEVADVVTYYSGRNLPAVVLEGINARAVEASRKGAAAVLVHFDKVRDHLRSQLPVEPSDRMMRIPAPASPMGEGPVGRYMRLEDFLVTRAVEVVVHSDDLAASVSLPTPTYPRETSDSLISFFVETSRCRHGDAAVIRAFTRRERDTINALRVF
jgi:Mycothiol maleylpyruvate isomerase N-terminal domain